MKSLLILALVIFVSLFANYEASAHGGRGRLSRSELAALRRAQIRAELRAERFDRFSFDDRCHDDFGSFRGRRRGPVLFFGF